MKKIIVLITIVAISVVLFLFFQENLKISLDKFIDAIFSRYTHKATVLLVENGHRLTLSSGETVDMIGVYMPGIGEDNHFPESTMKIKKMIEGKMFTIKRKLKKADIYPKLPLVEVLLENGESLTEKLLKDGTMFFDHGFYVEEKKYWLLEKEARGKRRGIWKNPSRLELKYVSSRAWNIIHYPNCPEVAKAQPVERIDYFFMPAEVVGYRTVFYEAPHGCPTYYKEIFLKNADAVQNGE